MISIIISSYQEVFFNALSHNIKETCGVPYEIIRIENDNKMGICEAYNKGALQAQYDNLLFLHEDVVFHTHNWGKKLVNHLSKPGTGVIGVAGCDYLPQAPSGWNIYSDKHKYVHILQNNKSATAREIISINTDKLPHPVITLDGVFLAVKKEVYQKTGFSDEIDSFHGYDLDFCINVAAICQNFVVGDILIEHFSPGNMDVDWFTNNILVNKKKKFLTRQRIDPDIEKSIYINFINAYFRFFGVTKNNLIKVLRFYPKGLSLNGHLTVLKTIMQFIRHRHHFNNNGKTLKN